MGLMGVISGLKLKKNGKEKCRREQGRKGKVPVMGNDRVLPAPSQVPYRNQLGRGHHPWPILCLQASAYPANMGFQELMLMNFILVGPPDAFLLLCSRPEPLLGCIHVI